LPKNLDLKIDKKYINSIRIAQVEFFEYECLEVNEKYILKKIDDILFCFVNQHQCNKKVEEEINKIKLSNYTLNLNTINLNKSTIILIFLIFIFINSYFIIGIISYKKEFSILQQKKEKLKKYNLPLTTFQLDAIYANLKEIDNKQKLIRKNLEFFSKTPLKKNEKYITLSFNKYYKVEINTSRNLDSFFSQRFNIKNSQVNKNIYKAVLSNE